MVCPYCTSMYVKKDGKKFNKGSTNQKFKCNSCSKNFSVPFETALPDEYPSVKPGEIFSIKWKHLTYFNIFLIKYLDFKRFLPWYFLIYKFLKFLPQIYSIILCYI